MKISQCAAFAAVVDTNSFTGAARALAVSQSAISHSISGLEAELGVALMRRDRSGVELTDVGERVLPHARAVLVHSQQMRDKAGMARSGTANTIRIGTSQSFATRLLPRLMTDLQAHVPQLEVSLREGDDAQIAEWLHGQAIDVGIVTLPKEHLMTVPLLQDEMYVVLPQEHRLASRASLTLAQLAGEPLVMPAGAVEPTLRGLFRNAGLDLTVAHRVRDLNALMALVAESLGVTILPALALPTLPPGLRIVPLTPAITRDVAIGVHPVARSSPAVTAFIAAARKLARRNDWLPAVVGSH